MKRSDRPLNLTYFGNTISYDLQNFKSVLLVGFPDLENHPLIDEYTTSCESNGTQHTRFMVGIMIKERDQCIP